MEKTVKEILEFGIINLDKCSGPTSFGVSDFVHKKLGLRKTSHFGTLDPKVTGVLPIALNRACKLTGYFIGHEKEYVGVMRVHEDVDLEKVQKVINEKFVGKIKQTPPVRSRVKRQEREREVKSFEVLEKDGKDILFRVVCEGGTYIRKLIDDLGKELGIGAHMLELRRTRAGVFSEDENSFVNLYDLEKAVENYLGKEKISLDNKFASEASVTGTQNGRAISRDEIPKANLKSPSEVGSWAGEASEILEDKKLLREIIIPAEDAIKKVFSVVQIKEDSLKQILTGKPITKKDLVEDNGWKVEEVVAVFCGERFIGIYKIFRGKEIFAKAEFVMQEIKN